jgi:hypothetical protein
MVAASAASADFSRYSKPPPLGGGAFTIPNRARSRCPGRSSSGASRWYACAEPPSADAAGVSGSAPPEAPGWPRTSAAPQTSHTPPRQDLPQGQPAASPGDPRGAMRRRIVALLQDHPDGLAPAEMRTLLGVNRSLADTCLGMLRYGLVQRVQRGRYVATEPTRTDQP